MKFLLHPRITFAIVVSACAFIDTVCAGIMTSIAPLEHVRSFEDVAPTISVACVVLGIVANVALALAGIGRSFITAIDNVKYSVAEGGGNAAGGASAGTQPTAEGK